MYSMHHRTRTVRPEADSSKQDNCQNNFCDILCGSGEATFEPQQTAACVASLRLHSRDQLQTRKCTEETHSQSCSHRVEA